MASMQLFLGCPHFGGSSNHFHFQRVKLCLLHPVLASPHQAQPDLECAQHFNGAIHVIVFLLAGVPNHRLHKLLQSGDKKDERVVFGRLVKEKKGGWKSGRGRGREEASPAAVHWTEIYCQCGSPFNLSVDGRLPCSDFQTWPSLWRDNECPERWQTKQPPTALFFPAPEWQITLHLRDMCDNEESPAMSFLLLVS